MSNCKSLSKILKVGHSIINSVLGLARFNARFGQDAIESFDSKHYYGPEVIGIQKSTSKSNELY
jgi:hypothetical protein